MLTHRFDDAVRLAEEAHRHQRRKGTDIPYISQLMAVSALTLEYGGDEDCAIAALLHDAVEDQGGTETANRIGQMFGPRVEAIVLACCDSSEPSKAPWKERKVAYLASIANKSDDAMLVTACDKLHNATAILTDLRQSCADDFDLFTATRADVLWYYKNLAEAISRRRGDDALSRRLGDIVTSLCAEVREARA